MQNKSVLKISINEWAIIMMCSRLIITNKTQGYENIIHAAG